MFIEYPYGFFKDKKVKAKFLAQQLFLCQRIFSSTFFFVFDFFESTFSGFSPSVAFGDKSSEGFGDIVATSGDIFSVACSFCHLFSSSPFFRLFCGRFFSDFGCWFWWRLIWSKSNFPSSASQFSLSSSSGFPINWNTALSPMQIAVAKYKPPQSHFLLIS